MISGVVVDFGKEATISKITFNDKSYLCEEQFKIDTSAAGFFENKEKLEQLFEKLSKYTLANNALPLIVSVSDSRYIYYRTDAISQDNLIGLDSKMSLVEQEDAVIESCKNLKPIGINYILDDVLPTCMSSYFHSSEVFLSCGFISEKIVLAINDVAEKQSINLLGIKPFLYGIFNAYNDLGSNLIFEFDENLMLMNEYGLIVWDKMENFVRSDVVTFLQEEAEKVFGIDNNNLPAVIIDTEDEYYRNNLVAGHYDNYEAVSAIGCFMEYKYSKQNTEVMKGEKNGATNSIWEFLKKKISY